VQEFKPLVFLVKFENDMVKYQLGFFYQNNSLRLLDQ